LRPLLLVLLPLVASCGAPDLQAAFTRFDVQVTDGSGAVQQFVALIDQADKTLDIALPALEDTDLSDAIIAARDRGVKIRAITDYDQAGDAGTVALLDAGVPVTLADDGITYFYFNIKADVAWTSQQTIMSDAWVIADRKEAVVASEAGSKQDGTRVTIDIVGEDLLIDLEAEHNQIFGGEDAVSKTAYDDLAKSQTDNRWAYPTQTDQIMEVWFGPQQRLTKRIIDAVYGARSSVKVLTDDFANTGLTAALESKAREGFDVQVVVGPAFASTSYFESQQLVDATPDVHKHRICGDVEVPTVVLTDYDPARNGRQYPSKAFVLTHSLYAAARLFRGNEVITDQLIDGSLWVFDDYDAPSGAMQTLLGTWQDHLDQSTGGLSCP